MAKLFGAQVLILEAIHNLSVGGAGSVTDDQIAKNTKISLGDVRDWIETLDGEGLVDVARTKDEALLTSITAKGRLQLRLYRYLPPERELADLPPAPTDSIPRGIDDAEEVEVVLLIHGIRDQGEWQSMLQDKLAVPGRIEVIPIKYGFFDALRFWSPFWTRNRPIERVYTQIRVVLMEYRGQPKLKLSVIAHSFGTYVIGEILRRGFDLHFHRLIFCGAVLPKDFPWHQYRDRFGKVVNDCGKADIWPVLAQSLSWGYGDSGTHGFGVVLVKDRFHPGGHGQYFKQEFVDKYWEPFIRRGQYQGSDFEKKMPPSPWWLSVLGILPLKWVIVLVPILILYSEGPQIISSVSGGSATHQPNERKGTRPSELDRLKRAKAAIEQRFSQPLGASTTDSNPSLGERRLKQAVFLSLYECDDDVELVKKSLENMQKEKFFEISGFDDVHLDSVVEQLASVRLARLLWLRRTVIPALIGKSEANIPLPDYALIEYRQGPNPLVRMISSEVNNELGKLE